MENEGFQFDVPNPTKVSRTQDVNTMTLTEHLSPLFQAVIFRDASAVSSLVDREDTTSKNKCVLAASFDGNETILNILLQSGGSPICVDRDRRTPLHHTISKGHENCFKVLIEWCEKRFFSIAKCALMADKLGATPLHYASLNGNIFFITLFLRYLKPGMIDPTDSLERTPLHWAAFYGCTDTLHLLLKSKADPFSRDVTCKTPLHFAVTSPKDISTNPQNETKQYYYQYSKKVDSHCITKLLQAAPSIIKWRDHEGASVLHLAVIDDSFTTSLSTLLAHHADVNVIDNHSRTPMHWAAARGCTTKMKELLKANARFDTPDEFGAEPLYYSVMNRHIECAELLVHQHQQRKGACPPEVLTWAAAVKADQFLADIIKQGVELLRRNKENIDWCPALHVAAFKGHVSTVALILSVSQLPNSADDDGVTPLHLAAYGEIMAAADESFDQFDDEEATDVVVTESSSSSSGPRKRLFSKELRCMMYGFGDDQNPYTESVDMLEDIVIEFITQMTQQAMEVGRSGRVQVEDVLYLVRRDKRKSGRVQELLNMNEELKRARKAFDEVKYVGVS